MTSHVKFQIYNYAGFFNNYITKIAVFELFIPAHFKISNFKKLFYGLIYFSKVTSSFYLSNFQINRTLKGFQNVICWLSYLVVSLMKLVCLIFIFFSSAPLWMHVQRFLIGWIKTCKLFPLSHKVFPQSRGGLGIKSRKCSRVKEIYLKTF